jgi:hypothetical protein
VCATLVDALSQKSQFIEAKSSALICSSTVLVRQSVFGWARGDFPAAEPPTTGVPNSVRYPSGPEDSNTYLDRVRLFLC